MRLILEGPHKDYMVQLDKDFDIAVEHNIVEHKAADNIAAGKAAGMAAVHYNLVERYSACLLKKMRYHLLNIA